MTVRAQCQPCEGMESVGDHTAELIERGQRARGGDLEHRAMVAIRPAVRGCPVEKAVGSLDETRKGAGAIGGNGVVELMQGGEVFARKLFGCSCQAGRPKPGL